MRGSKEFTTNGDMTGLRVRLESSVIIYMGHQKTLQIFMEDPIGSTSSLF
jgi:hypothetical protein